MLDLSSLLHSVIPGWDPESSIFNQVFVNDVYWIPGLGPE